MSKRVKQTLDQKRQKTHEKMSNIANIGKVKSNILSPYVKVEL